MIEDTIRKLEEAIRRAGEADPKQRAELTRLLERLKEELRALPPAHAEEAGSIAHFAQAVTHEAARRERSGRLLELSTDGLKESVAGFEVTHPRLTEIVNEICNLLAAGGI